MRTRVLVVDDEQDMCDQIAAELAQQGTEAVAVTSAQEALERIASEDFDVVLTDLGMTDHGSGADLCERLVGTCSAIPVVVVTAHGTVEAAIAAMRAGAYDFITKPLDKKLLALSVARAVQHRRLRAEVKRLEGVITASSETHGSSAAMRRVHDLVARIADSDATVLIHGETGTGKELVARAIHDASPRKDRPFVAINCAAVPEPLIESELFGHARGAFTDAKVQRTGLFLEANGGTLLLDEVGELPLSMQPKLLRALQERKVRPVGSNAEVPFDARILAATNRNLDDEVYEKRFREDLYYRINVVRIEVPPLRERGGDVLDLASAFLVKLASRNGKPALTLSPPAAEKLLGYAWPGNVRELENCMERAVALARFEQVMVEDLPEKVRAYRAERFVVAADDAAEIVTIDQLEQRYILRVLSLVGGNKSRAAEVLGVDRRTLYRKLARYAGERPAQATQGEQPWGAQ
jgi:two-component system response regulator HydG